ncbi:hypothetical protein CAPTEDRAFT_226725 [Capitella teleta]|uniref:Uncharacterized protein n=1 Tax=Capitella teleta TaxID=283909 RepID=R7V8N9_CAPTE|nr:hypothetical protein CAPTEDRAFT_226725 [Capitella teleta]|eukprot:ELU14882.1 hypothetical protein CAPTEDRAFT_226725 [Capitella teleta]
MVISLFSESCNSCLLYKIGSFFQGPSRNVVMVTSFLVLLSCSVVNAAPRTRRVPSQRWQVPCGGKNPVEPGLENIWEEVFGEEAFEEDPESLALTYHDMARKATVVKDKIFELRDKMIIERIGSLTLVESLDQGGFSLKGMPQTTAIEDVSDEQSMFQLINNQRQLQKISLYLEATGRRKRRTNKITGYLPHETCCVMI